MGILPPSAIRIEFDKHFYVMYPIIVFRVYFKKKGVYFYQNTLNPRRLVVNYGKERAA
jgi:hypothetical protein